MSTPRFPRLTRTLLFFALLQALLPSFTAVADAWRLDRMTPYAHIESETGTGCPLVHGDECPLCSASETLSRPVRRVALVPGAAHTPDLVPARSVRLPAASPRNPASQRAPPTVNG